MEFTTATDTITRPAAPYAFAMPSDVDAQPAPFGPAIESGAGSEIDSTTGWVDDAAEHPDGTAYARCSDGYGTLSALFFSDDELDIARAQAICATCGLRDDCLAGAIERMEPYGVWGGKLVIDGVPLDAKPRRGRPPKQPRPVLVVDEVPVPPHLVA